MKMLFSNPDTREIFSISDFSSYKQLMFDTGLGREKVSKDQANKKLRDIMYSVLGVDDKCSRKELRKAIRKHKIDVYEIIEETVENLLNCGWGENPFFNECVEYRSMNSGDTNEFYVPDDMILTVSEMSGGHHNLIRQRISGGQTFSVKTSWLGCKIYTEFELFMAGRIDWAEFIQKIYQAFDNKINSMVYKSFVEAGNKVLPSSQFCKTIDFSAPTAREEIITLVEDVQTANGVEAVIIGTKTALSKLSGLGDINWISDSAKEERHTLGRVRLFEGIRVIEIPQVFNINTTERAIDDTKLFVMPQVDNKFIKVYDEGESQIREISDGTTNADMTVEYEYQQKIGVATVINRKFGTITID